MWLVELINEIALIFSAFENNWELAYSNTLYEKNPAVEQNKNVKWAESRRISPVGDEKVCGGCTMMETTVFLWKNSVNSMWHFVKFAAHRGKLLLILQ